MLPWPASQQRRQLSLFPSCPVSRSVATASAPLGRAQLPHWTIWRNSKTARLSSILVSQVHACEGLQGPHCNKKASILVTATSLYSKTAASLQQHASPRLRCVQASAFNRQSGTTPEGQPAWKKLGTAARKQQLQMPKKQQMQKQSITGKQQSKPRSAVGPLQQQVQDLLQLQQGIPTYATLRIAAAGSTELLIAFLNSHMHLLVGSSSNAVCTTPITDSGSSSGQKLTNRQRRALLRQSLVCISWHCGTHQLLPAEAQRLQDMMLHRLLPVLAPHVARTQAAVLARVMFALGTCAANVWDDELNGDAGDSSSGNSSWSAGSLEFQVLHRSTAAAQHNTVQQQKASAGCVQVGKQNQQSCEQVTALEPQQQQQDQQDQQNQGVLYHQQQLQQQQQQHSASSASGGPDPQVQLSSEAWIQLLLRCLPPQKLTAGALLAAWKGCALHEVRPPEKWLVEASTAAYYALQHNKLDFNDVAALLQACAQLEYSPPSWLMYYLVARAQQQLPFFNPADLSGVLSSLQALSFRPSNTFLRVWCESGSRLLRGMTVSQLAAAGEALSWAGYNPAPWWGRRFIDASLPLLPIATPDELLLLLDGALSLRLQPPVNWVHECYCHLRASRQQLSLSQIADAAHVLAHLQPLPDSLVAHHRAWLAQCLRQQQLEDVAALSRSELLYMLYAVGKLQVRRTKRWLSSALQQLHFQLAGAQPAELIATFVVFSYFRRQQQTQELVQLTWLEDILAAVCDSVKGISHEGLLQLLLACANLGPSQQQQQQQQQHTALQDYDSSIEGSGSSTDQQPRVEAGQHSQAAQAATAVHKQIDTKLQQSIDVLVRGFQKHTVSMDIVQLSRACKALESGGGSTRPAWFIQLLQQCKTALANRV